MKSHNQWKYPAYLEREENRIMSYGLIATLIVLAIVMGAITTKKCEAFLIAGSMVGAIVLWKQDFLTKWVSTLEGVISDEAYVILICGLLGSLVALLTASKGSFGFAVLVGIAVATGDLVVAAIIAILVSMVLYIAGKIMTFSEFWDTFVKGFSDMLPIIILLISALTFQKIASEMQMTEFFVDLCKPFMAGSVFPMITFIIVGLLAFMIANAWGVCTLVAPVLLPLGASVGANIILVMAAILSGCAFGNHACFYCDTTVLASNGAGIDNLEHAGSQLPYVLIGARISIVGFLILGFVM